MAKRPSKRSGPTEELRGFVATEEERPAKMLYPRDPSLDPQLVWKGKDEQDSKPLEVPVVPIYIQEKIHPQTLVTRALSSRREHDPISHRFLGIRIPVPRR